VRIPNFSTHFVLKLDVMLLESGCSHNSLPTLVVRTAIPVCIRHDFRGAPVEPPSFWEGHASRRIVDKSENVSKPLLESTMVEAPRSLSILYCIFTRRQIVVIDRMGRTKEVIGVDRRRLHEI
jgi:hypothetical protein